MAGETVQGAVDSGSGAGTTVSQAGSGAGGAQSGVGVDQRGAQSGAGQTDVASGYRSSGAEVTSDIGQSEAYILNMKKLVADELDHAANLRAVAADSIGRRARNAEDFDQQLRNLAQQSLTNAVSLQSRVTQKSVDHDARLQHYAESEVARTVREGDLATDRQWNIDEVSAAIAKNPVFQDAIAGAVAAAVAATAATTKKA